jgi:DNA-directed RNA polymerase specialized sigma54-like protein
MKRNTRTKAEQEYVRAIIHNLSLQRLSDHEITDYLRNEKQIEIARSTVANTRSRVASPLRSGILTSNSLDTCILQLTKRG